MSANSRNDSVLPAGLNGFAVEFLTEWIAADPRRETEVGPYYLNKLRRGRLFEPYDHAVSRYAADHFRPETLFVELGSGLGELGILLALESFTVTSFEFTSMRHAAAVALADALVENGASLAELSFLYARYPDDLTLKLLQGSNPKVFVATNAVSAYMRAHMGMIVRSLPLYDEVILDLNSFGFLRDKAEADELAAMLFALHFDDKGPVFLGGGYEIRHFSRRPLKTFAELEAISDRLHGRTLLYSDTDEPVPARVQRTPFHVFSALDIPIQSIFPRLDNPLGLIPPEAGWIETFPIPDNLAVAEPPRIVGTSPTNWRFLFSTFGPHYVSGYLGTFKCLLLDPKANRDSHALDFFRFVAANTLHSDMDRSTIAPWAARSGYVRPDLLLRKLFLSDQPLGLECSHTADLLAYLLHLAGFDVRRVDVVDPDVGSGGHTVVEAFLPEQQSWGMLDADFGVTATASNGRLLSVAELIEHREDAAAFRVVRAFDKHWAPTGWRTAMLYTGQATWSSAQPPGGPTVTERSYHEIVSRCFRKLDYTYYRFEDGFGDNTTTSAPKYPERTEDQKSNLAKS